VPPTGPPWARHVASNGGGEQSGRGVSQCMAQMSTWAARCALRCVRLRRGLALLMAVPWMMLAAPVGVLLPSAGGTLQQPVGKLLLLFTKLRVVLWRLRGQVASISWVACSPAGPGVAQRVWVALQGSAAGSKGWGKGGLALHGAGHGSTLWLGGGTLAWGALRSTAGALEGGG
jgi:hypothetical protein